MTYAISDRRGQQKLAIAQQLLPNTPSLPMGEFSLIVADPPWQYTLRETDKTHRNRTPYPTMKDENILAMHVSAMLSDRPSAIAAEDTYLLPWVTNHHLEPTTFHAPVGEHSAKPNEFFDTANRLENPLRRNRIEY